MAYLTADPAGMVPQADWQRNGVTRSRLPDAMAGQEQDYAGESGGVRLSRRYSLIIVNVMHCLNSAH